MVSWGSSMIVRWIVWALVALISVTAFQNTLADSEQNASANNSSMNVTLTPAAELVSIEGIWKVNLTDIEITLALNQSGDSIAGRCKFEGDEPWNGVVAGSISGTATNMALAALQGKLLVATQITGTVSNDALQGSYVSYDSDGKVAKGEVTGTRISPDVPGFTPAEVRAAPASAPAVVQQPQTIQQTQPTTEQQNQAEKRKVQDINELAKGINPNILPWSYPL
jgi:hypothetical protein